MVDDGTFIGAAAKELTEETGLLLNESDLTPLSTLISPSPGNWFLSIKRCV